MVNLSSNLITTKTQTLADLELLVNYAAIKLSITAEPKTLMLIENKTLPITTKTKTS